MSKSAEETGEYPKKKKKPMAKKGQPVLPKC
jgi:hypothetical protein